MLNSKALGLTLGILAGIYVFGFTLIGHFTGYGIDFLKMWEPLHPGYNVSIIGAFVGFGYNFVEFFAWGFLGATVYNRFNGE